MSIKSKMNRKDFMSACGRVLGLLGLGGLVGGLMSRNAKADDLVWQIDPAKCTQCGQCATHCVLETSCVKCFHEFVMCGYCELCTGFFEPRPPALTEAAENQACPTGAIKRSYIDNPYYEYDIDEDRCIGCGICVKGCTHFGNGSLYLQIRHDLCQNCNECEIAVHCPADAFVRVPAGKPYINRLRGQG